MTFVERYGKEIISLLVPVVTWTLNRFFKTGARLQIAQPHAFTFLVQQPITDPQGNVVAQTQTVHTKSIIVHNAGREPATNVELVFNWKPMCLNVWTPRHFREHQELDNRYVIIFDSLSPDEWIDCEVLSVNVDLPALVTARSDQSVPQFINMYPQPVVSRAVRAIGNLLMALGLAAAVYGTILLLQFLVLKTPLGH